MFVGGFKFVLLVFTFGRHLLYFLDKVNKLIFRFRMLVDGFDLSLDRLKGSILFIYLNILPSATMNLYMAHKFNEVQLLSVAS